MSANCPITKCRAATHNPGCGFHPNGLQCQHPHWRDAYRWRVYPVKSVLAVIVELGREVWRRRVKVVQGRLL